MTPASQTPSSNHADFGAKLTALRDLLADIAQSAPAAAGETFEGLKTKASKVCDTCEQKANHVTHVVVKTVKEHPGKIALVVIGTGLLAWWLLRSTPEASE